MTEYFSTIHSVLDNEALAKACAEQYGFNKLPYCEFFHRGMNDVYLLRTEAKQYAVRAWRANWRSMDDVRFELEFLEFLKDKGLPVVPGIRCRSGASHFVVPAPEGPRAIAAFEWVPGAKFAERADPKLVTRLGETMAEIHLAGIDFSPSKPRRTNPASLIGENLPHLERLIADHPKDLSFYRELAPRLIEALEGIKPGTVPMGACHGDFHLYNGLINDDDEITFLDFDNSGQDYYAQDVMGFCWANEFTGRPPAYSDHFIEGYESRRKMTDTERDHFALFILAKEFRLVTGYAKHVNALGHYLTHHQKGLGWFSTSVRKHAREAGLA
jgi:Ser/Thr protein kinase RdoA (MazF antagonist)